MDAEYEKRVGSILGGREGYAEEYSTIAEFKQHLKQQATLAEKELSFGWVLRREENLLEQHLDLYEFHHHHSNNTTKSRHKIKSLLKHMARLIKFRSHYLVQFWAEVKVKGRVYLTASDHPFSVGKLNKGLCWFRNQCVTHAYCVDEGAESKHLGGVARAYRNKHPESTPDLRLYSIHEFPLRDHAARCGLRGYMALPLFDFYSNESYGALEILSYHTTMETYLLSSLHQGLQNAGLRSTHINFIPICRSKLDMPNKYKQQDESEFTKMLELAIEAVPRLYLAQVWIPCKQCADMSTNLCCMERLFFINAQDRILNCCNDIDKDTFDYLQACEFHNLQIDHSCFCRNLCELSIAKNPLAHYAARARLPLCFTFCLKSKQNSSQLYIIEFFLQSKCGEDACSDSSLHLFLKIIEMTVKSFKLESKGQLLENLLVHLSLPNAIESETTDMLRVINSYMESGSELNFTKYLEAVDLCCEEELDEEELSNSDIMSNTLPVPKNSVTEKIQHVLRKIVVEFGENYWIVQFWAPKRVKNRCYLDTSDQPYALGFHAKGLASFRKKCMKHHYFVDKEAKGEELGPPGRVFRNGHPEITPDLLLYSKQEFPIRDYGVHCRLREYFALPVFDKKKHKCVGVLELIGFCYSHLGDIRRALEASNLRSTHIDFLPGCIADHKPASITNYNIEALTEIREVFLLLTKIPQLHMANVWVPYDKCASVDSNPKCMELVLSTKVIWGCVPQVDWIHIQPKRGMIGMVLESESKSCFCLNLCEFSIADQTLAHYDTRERRDVCFAICLQSVHTGGLFYVVEFFLNQGPATYEYLRSFLNFLVPIMKQQLKSFRIASGKQLGEELVVEVIEFSEANKLTSSESDQSDVFPVKFESVRYGQMELQNNEEQLVKSASYATQTEQCSAVTSDFKTTKRGKRKIGLHLSLEFLKPHFGKKLKDVAEELGVGRSTIKRACREYGIDRWPGNKKQARNPSLFERESEQDPQHDMQPSSNRNLQLLDASVHQNVSRTNTESTHHPTDQEEAEKMIIKVKCEKDTIKFELCLSPGAAGKLFEG